MIYVCQSNYIFFQNGRYEKLSQKHSCCYINYSNILAAVLVLLVISVFLLPGFYLQHYFNVIQHTNFDIPWTDKEHHPLNVNSQISHTNNKQNKFTLPPPPKPDYNQCKLLNVSERYDCFPEDGANVESCEARGCCWIPVKTKSAVGVKLDVPYCFFPPNYDSYNYVNITETAYGCSAFLRRKYRSPYPSDVETIRMDVRFETATRLHVKVS